MKVYTWRHKFTHDGVEYTWCGGFGCVIESFERGVSRNDVRMIGDTIFSACHVGNCGWNRRICWIPQGDFDAEWMRKCKQEIFK